MFNKIKKGADKAIADASKERDAICIPIAEEVIKMIGNHKAVIGVQQGQATFDNYASLTTQILEFFLEKDIKFVDSNYIMRLVLEHFNTTQDFVIQSLNKSMDRAEEKLWQKELDKVTMSDIDKILK